MKASTDTNKAGSMEWLANYEVPIGDETRCLQSEFESIQAASTFGVHLANSLHCHSYHESHEIVRMDQGVNVAAEKEWFVKYAEIWNGDDTVFQTVWFESELEAAELCFHVICCGVDDWELGRVTAGLKVVVPMSDCDECGGNVPPALLRKSVLDGKPAEICPPCYGPTAEDIANYEAEQADKTERRLVYHATPEDPFGISGLRGHENITANLCDILSAQKAVAL